MTVGNEEADILRTVEEENRERGEAIANSHLVRSACSEGCGADALSTPERVAEARCGTCLQSRAGSGTGAYSGPYTVPVGYPRASFTPEEPERFEHPAPAVTSRQPVPVDTIEPDAVLKLRIFAGSYGWTARVQYARGNRVHGTTGKPTAVTHSWAVRIGEHSGTSAMALAVYLSDASGKNWTWKSVWMFGPELKPFGQGGITDLKEWLAQDGNVPVDWYQGVADRVAEQERQRKQREACNRGTHPKPYIERRISEDVVNLTCCACGNSWKKGAQTWRKPKKEKEHS